MKEYDVRILVGALYRGEENNPYTGDLEGDIEFDEDGLGVFDGQYISEESLITVGNEEFRVISDGIPFKEILHQASSDLELIESKQAKKDKPMEIVD